MSACADGSLPSEAMVCIGDARAVEAPSGEAGPVPGD
jgi:hypothetical protein